MHTRGWGTLRGAAIHCQLTMYHSNFGDILLEFAIIPLAWSIRRLCGFREACVVPFPGESKDNYLE
jgi:hypothetical protein